MDLSDPTIQAILAAVGFVAALITIVEFVWKPIRRLLGLTDARQNTVHAEGHAVAAGGNIRAPTVTGQGAIATDQAAAVTAPGAGTVIVAQPGANVTIYIDGLPAAEPQVHDPFEEGRRFQDQDRHEEAIKAFQRALASATDPSHRGALHLFIGISHHSLSQFPQAEGSYTEALRLFTSSADEQGRAAALCNLGIVYADRGDLDRAEDHLNRALDIHHRIGNRLGEAAVLSSLGTVYDQRGDLHRARQQYENARQILREIGDRLGQANQPGNLGNVHFQRGDLDRAEDFLRQALVIYEEIGASGNAEKTRRALARIEEQKRQQPRPPQQ